MGTPGYGQPPTTPVQPKPEAESSSGETRQDVHLLEWMTFGIGFTGGAGASILDKPGEQNVRGADLRPHYPGFAGIATALGPMIEFRFYGYVGIELDILIASDSGSADLTVNNFGTGVSNSFEVDIGHSAVRVPLLLKVFAPGKVATPSLFIGPEFVVVSDEADFEAGSAHELSPVQYGAFTESYTMLAFGMGLEFNLPVKAADLRVPFSIRGGFNPSVGGTREERTRHTPDAGVVTGESFSTAFKFQIGAQLGMAVHF